MRIPTFLIYCAFFLCATSGYSADFPTADKMYGATIIKIQNIDSDDALAIGEVRRPNAEEFCERDPGGLTKKYGGKLTFQQCVDYILKKERGRKVSATADCFRKKVTLDSGRTYVLKDRIRHDTWSEHIWADNSSGAILEDTTANSTNTINGTFQMLCPAFMK